MKGIRMKRISLVAALLGAIVFAFAGIASAGTGTTYGNSSGTGANNKGTAVNHYTANYTDPVYGPVNCIGVNQVKAKQGTQESFTCTSTTGNQLSGATPGAAVTLPNGYWWTSDFNPSLTTYNLSGTVSADGMSYTAVATY
jgi:hypothetical protein